MTEVSAYELHRDAAGVLRRVEAGEQVTITVAGRPVAELRPLATRRWTGRAEFARRLSTAQADPGLTAELRELVRETVDDPF